MITLSKAVIASFGSSMAAEGWTERSDDYGPTPAGLANAGRDARLRVYSKTGYADLHFITFWDTTHAACGVDTRLYTCEDGTYTFVALLAQAISASSGDYGTFVDNGDGSVGGTDFTGASWSLLAIEPRTGVVGFNIYPVDINRKVVFEGEAYDLEAGHNGLLHTLPVGDHEVIVKGGTDYEALRLTITTVEGSVTWYEVHLLPDVPVYRLSVHTLPAPPLVSGHVITIDGPVTVTIQGHEGTVYVPAGDYTVSCTAGDYTGSCQVTVPTTDHATFTLQAGAGYVSADLGALSWDRVSIKVLMDGEELGILTSGSDTVAVPEGAHSLYFVLCRDDGRENNFCDPATWDGTIVANSSATIPVSFNTKETECTICGVGTLHLLGTGGHIVSEVGPLPQTVTVGPNRYLSSTDAITSYLIIAPGKVDKAVHVAHLGTTTTDTPIQEDVDGSIRVTSITVDGVDQPLHQYTLTIGDVEYLVLSAGASAGTHTITLKRYGCPDIIREVTVIAGEETEVSCIVESPPCEVEFVGLVPSDATVKVDGRIVVPGDTVSVGTRVITVSADGYITSTTTKEAKANLPFSISVQLSEVPPPDPIFPGLPDIGGWFASLNVPKAGPILIVVVGLVVLLLLAGPIVSGSKALLGGLSHE